MVREKSGPASRMGRGGQAWLGATLVVFAGVPLLVGSAACGGRVLILVPYSDDGAAPVSGPEGDASASGVSPGTGGGSSDSSSGTTPLVEAAAGSSSGSAGSSGGGGVGGGLCTSAADCAPDLICCATQDLVPSCLPGPCPAQAPLQFCATFAECVMTGDSCTFLLTEPEDSYLVCTPPAPASSH